MCQVLKIVDLMETPCFGIVRSGHPTMGPFASKTVAILRFCSIPNAGRILSFAEPMLFFKIRPLRGDENFPCGRFVPRNPQANEMLTAVREAINLSDGPQPLSALQRRYAGLDENSF